METQEEDSQAVQDVAKKHKPKKKQDFAAHLETLLDKLTIWYSLESHWPAKNRSHGGQDTPDDSNDELKNFCTEIVIPFYVSRAPQHAAVVNKKLGGPTAPTPVKRAKSCSTRKPGEPAIRQAPEKKARQPLARVSTDTLDQASRRPFPSLHRSATDSDTLATYIKRETSASVPPMESIPVAKAPCHAARSRPSLISHMSNFGRREVDLSAMSQASEAKMRKKAEVEEKLREAISTLRKPDEGESRKRNC